MKKTSVNIYVSVLSVRLWNMYLKIWEQNIDQQHFKISLQKKLRDLKKKIDKKMWETIDFNKPLPEITISSLSKILRYSQ